MNTTSFRARTLACILLASAASVSFPGAAHAQKLVNIPADHYAVAPGGVDMRTGRYVYDQTDVSAGPLNLTRAMPNYVGSHANPFANFSHNWDIFLLESRPDLSTGADVGPDFRLNVHHSGRSFTFEGMSTTRTVGYVSSGPRATLTLDPVSTGKADANAFYTYRSPDGTEMVFRPMGGQDCADGNWGSYQRRCAFISEMTNPDGEKFSFSYDYDAGATGNRARLRQVTSSRGYALLLEGTGSRVTKACTINLARATLPSNGLCPVSAVATASYTYNGGNTKLLNVTDPTGAVWGFTYGSSGTQTVMGFVKPGQTTPWLTNTITMRADEEYTPQETIDRQDFANGQSYVYTYGFAPTTSNRPHRSISGGFYVDAEGRRTRVEYDFPILPGTHPMDPCQTLPCSPPMEEDYQNSTYQQTPGPTLIEDALGRQTKLDYCDANAKANLPSGYRARCFVLQLQSFTDPEGMKTLLEYDGALNIKTATQNPKPNSGLSPIVKSATFDITQPKYATKPTQTVDAKGNITDYTYDPAHGGILTETGPLVNGVRPQKRYTYAQRYARISNGAGYVQAASPVWVLTQESFCKSGSASGNGCAIAGDEVRTTYDYGPDSGPNNLLLRGKVVDAGGLSLRTCYAYDARGNKISETKPRANLTNCP